MMGDATDTIEVAALGRPFGLGMLYDCRKDSLIPGIKLWDSDDLKKNIQERQQSYNDFEIVASESVESKCSALNVDASLKASFLGGLVEVGGSANYLNDTKTSNNQARVTLRYKATTKFQELSMDHLASDKVRHQNVFDKGIATHVVTGILYGAQAFFVFDREVSEHENHQKIQGNLKVMIKKIPLLSIEGDGSLKMEDKDKQNVDKFSCKFIGDFSLQKTPTSFQDAVEVYRSLPKLLGSNGENAVPMKVWLLPLTCFDSSAAKLVREISIRLVNKAQSVLEDFSELEMRCNDALRTNIVQQFPQIGKKLKSFQEMCSEFKLEFQRTLAKKLPSIRGGGEEEAELAEILKKRHSSPFSSKHLNEWMDCKENEMSILKSFTEKMKNTKIIPSQNRLHEHIFSVEHAVCFVLPSLGSAEPYLSDLSDYLEAPTKAEKNQDALAQDVKKEQWYSSSEIVGAMSNKVKLFSDFAEANQGKDNIAFLTVASPNEAQKGSSIYLYKDGVPVTENFEPPSKPESVTVGDINHNSVTLKISPPKFGAENLTSYSVECSVVGENEWKQKSASKTEEEEVTVTNLNPNTEYKFRVRAMTSVGVGPAKEAGGSFKTFPCSPPEKLQSDSNSREITISWDRPSEIGEDVQILSYIVEYAKTNPAAKQEDLKWNQKTTKAEIVTISGLQPETEYVFRVSCDCGAAGRSKESITVTVRTTTFSLVEILKSKSERINSESPSLYKLPLTEEYIYGCQWFNFGQESARKNRTVLLFGEPGSGKSTLINAMINYIVGVEWEDSCRFKIIVDGQSKSQAHSQTSEATVYKINHQEGFKIDYSLTIVDTQGKETDEKIRDILIGCHQLFTARNGVSEIDAVCFVVQASLAPLTPTQRFVFDRVLSIFGKDVAENIRVLVTFADAQQPPVLETIRASGVPCPKTEDGLPVHFKFNNSALFANNQSSGAEGTSDEEGGFDQIFWEMGRRSMKKFFIALNAMETKSRVIQSNVARKRQSTKRCRMLTFPSEEKSYNSHSALPPQERHSNTHHRHTHLHTHSLANIYPLTHTHTQSNTHATPNRHTTPRSDYF